MTDTTIEPGLPGPPLLEGRQKEPWPKLEQVFCAFRDGKRKEPREKDPRFLTSQYFPRSDVPRRPIWNSFCRLQADA